MLICHKPENFLHIDVDNSNATIDKTGDEPITAASHAENLTLHVVLLYKSTVLLWPEVDHEITAGSGEKVWIYVNDAVDELFVTLDVTNLLNVEVSLRLGR